MQLHPDQIASEMRVDENHPIIRELVKEGAKEPKVVLVFDQNDAGTDWAVRIFYNSPIEMREVRLNVPTTLKEESVLPQQGEVVRTIYPNGYVGYCTQYLNTLGGRVWIT